MRLLLAACVILPALAGCAEEAPTILESGTLPTGGTVSEPTGEWNLTTPYLFAAPYTRELTGVLRQPFFPAPTGTCCFFDGIPADDLFVQDGPVQMRITLTWTNEPQNQADLDIAACIPYYCDFTPVADQSAQMGAQQETITIVTGRFSWWEEYAIGVRYQNAAVLTQLPYTLSVEVAPLERALSYESWPVTLAPGANLTAELFSPLTTGEITANLLVHGEDHRPLRWISLTGPVGSRHALNLGAGSWVLTVFWVENGAVRLLTDARPEPAALEPLKREFERVEMKAIATPDAQSGTLEIEAPPGTFNLWPWFEYADGPQIQPRDVLAHRQSVTSSSGVVSEGWQSRIGIGAMGEQYCLMCTGWGQGRPENLVDDDNRYTYAYEASGAMGSFILWTGRYVPPR